MARHAPPDSGRQPTPDGPAADLADVWEALDVLPTAAASADMAATTVDLMAVKLGQQAKATQAAGGSAWPRWLAPVATVAAALLAGIVLGRVTAPDPVVQNLPYIRHIDLLQEAGSLRFLEALADLMATERPIQPRWFRLARDPDAVRDEAREFEAQIDALRQDFAAETASARRQRLEAISLDQADALEKSAETFFGLSPVDRRDLESVARALVDPAVDRLRDAARLWHVIIAATPPPMRRAVVEMRIDDRLEWLERPAGGDPRGGNRSREDEWGGDRRPGSRRSEPGEVRPGQPAGERPQLPPGERARPPVRPAGPPPGADASGLRSGSRAGPGPRRFSPPGAVETAGLSSAPEVRELDQPPPAVQPAGPAETPAPPR